MLRTALPQLDPCLQQHSDACAAYISKKIAAHGGSMTFAEFMQSALYAPQHGYYRNAYPKFAADGDFITAPDISPLFAKCLARSLAALFTPCGKKHILELGPGNGSLLVQLLLALEALDALPTHYYCLELSAELQQRQQQRLQQHCPHLVKRVQWLQQLPHGFCGVVLANEVLDAMPVERFHWQHHTLQQYFVGCGQASDSQATEFCWQLKPAHHNLTHAITPIKHLLEALDPEQPYTSEINLWHAPWLESLSQSMQQGIVLLIDYGYPQAEYYHPQRDQGTLTCFLQHRQHANSLLYPGAQDISAHVDFTHIANSADQAGFDIAHYTSQAQFLYDCGLAELLQQHNHNPAQQYQQSQQIQTLTAPQQMGETVKVMCLTKQLADDVDLSQHPGFSLQSDRRHQLAGLLR